MTKYSSYRSFLSILFLSFGSLCRFFYQFLLANERTVAKEIRDEYVDTMSKIYYSYFKSYSGRLLKVQVSDSQRKRQIQTNRIPRLLYL